MSDSFRTIVDDVARDVGLDITWLDASSVESLRRRLRSIYGTNEVELTTDANFGGVSLRREESWEHIADFGWSGEVVLFTNPRRSVQMARLETLEHAHRLLAEAPPFDFLLTEPAGTFVLSHNRYDKLTGAGLAEAFVRRLL